MNSSHPTTRPSSRRRRGTTRRDAAAVIGPIIDDLAFYHLGPSAYRPDRRIADDAYQEVLRAAINDLYYFGPLEDLLYDESLSRSWSTGPTRCDRAPASSCSPTCTSRTTTT
ncbi:MAG: hypothetical protein ACLT98_00795 [Eggerthellaceae bacterium]